MVKCFMGNRKRELCFVGGQVRRSSDDKSARRRSPGVRSAGERNEARSGPYFRTLRVMCVGYSAVW